METKTKKELASLIIDAINDERLNDLPVSEIHNEVFNTDYFIIGRHDAEKWLIDNGGIFNAIDTIKEYEQEMFSKVTTDFSEPEKVCNMYVYILGEELLNSLPTIEENWDNNTNSEILYKLKKQLENI